MNKNIINKKVSLLIVNLILVPLLGLTNATLVHAQEIKAEWMRGSFGVGFNYRAGDEELDVSDVRGFDVQAAVDQASSIEGTGWVLFNLTSTAHGDRLLAPLPLLEEVNPLAAPTRDLFGELVEAYQAKGLRVIAYVATQGPAMLKHGAEKAYDFDETIANSTCKKSPPSKTDADNTVYCSASMNRWRDKVLSLYTGNESLYTKFQTAMAKDIIRPLSIKYGNKIDGWWFDHAIYGNIPKLRNAALAGNENAVIAFNDGQKIPLINNNPGLEDFTFGHPNPMAVTPPQDDYNLPIIESIESAPEGIFYGRNGEESLGHMFLPIQEKWYSGQVVFSESKGSEWSERILNAGGALTWSVALKADIKATENSPEIPGGFLMEEAQVKLIKRINYNRGKQLHLMLEGEHNGRTNDTSLNSHNANIGNATFSLDPTRGYVGNFKNSPISVTGYKGVSGDQARTVGLWVKTSSATGKLVQWGSNKQGKRWWVQLSGGKPAVLVHGASTTSSQNINDGQWHHVAVTSTDSSFSNVKIYIDGLLDSDQKYHNSTLEMNTAKGGDVLIGKDFIGQLDDIVVHNTALSAGNVAYAASAEAGDDIELAVKMNLDDASSDTMVADQSIYGRNGAILNPNLGVTDAVRGPVAYFDGNSYIEISPSIDLTLSGAANKGFNGIPGKEPRTIMGWVKTNINTGDLVQYGNYTPIRGEIWRLGIANNSIKLNVKGGSVTSSTVITDGQWHHFALVAPNNQLSNVKMYIDGKLETTVQRGGVSSFDTYTSDSVYDKLTGSLSLKSKNVRIGHSGFNGYLDDVIMHQRALSQYEIKNMAGL